MAIDQVFDPSAYGKPPGRLKQAQQIELEAPSSGECKPIETSDQVEGGLDNQPFIDQQAPSSRGTESGVPRKVLNQEEQVTSLFSREIHSPTIIGDLVFKPDITRQKSKPLSLTKSSHSPVSNILRASDRTPSVNQFHLQTTQAEKSRSSHKSQQDTGALHSAHSTRSRNSMPFKVLNDMTGQSEQLRQLQSDSLQSISRNIAASRNKGKDRFNTTSLRDLDLARAPVDSTRPGDSRRTWAEDSPFTNGNRDEDYELIPPTKLESLHAQPPAPHTSQQSIPITNPPDPLYPGRRKWAAKDEMKAENEDLGSNAWGSAAPSDATHASNISDEYFGKLLNRYAEEIGRVTLADWEGKIVAPPADWSDRPRYNNNNLDFKASFKTWLLSMRRDAQKNVHFSNGVVCSVIPRQALEDTSNHADGISLTKRSAFIDINNAEHYGYGHHVADTVKYARPVDATDFEDWGKLDPRDPDNTKFRNETTEDLVSNWLRHLQNSRIASTEVGSFVKENQYTKGEEEVTFSLPDQRYIPELNIYLRPATIADLPELTKIYNWHIAYSSAPVETEMISESEMESRLQLCKQSYLPFIVAAKKSQKGATEIPLVSDEELSRQRNLPVRHKQRLKLTRVELLAGFCCAQDLTAPDYVEHISAELEVYVHPEYRKKGVGKCLMDKMLEICDRGHRMITDCTFHCDQAIRQTYRPGGIRNVHKLFVLLRKWHYPRPAVINVDGKRKHRKTAFAKTNEEAFESWLKPWLESLGFEEEGFLKKVGAKGGRYLDMIYFGRETAWQPAEGTVPGPDPRHKVFAQDMQNDADEQDDT